MSLEDEIRNSPIKDAQSFQEPSKKQSRTAYTRSFLLSLGELDVCKELPSGVDLSILSEFEEVCQLQGGRQRNHGNLPLQSFRRNEYGSSPPTRGDSSNFARGYGRWDNNSGSWNDRDSDTQSDKDSDTGWRPGNLSRRSSQTSEHDGLLGSGGSFPRTSSGYTAGLSASKSARPSDQYQLNKSTEPYHPPRPYKAVPHGRRETKDSLNDETFGSSESTSQDKMEDERRRRASFELMRKEQHKSLQESQKPDPDKHRDGQGSNISELLDDTNRDLKRPFGTSGVDEPVNPATADSSKISLQSQVSRPRVPPGFKSTTIPEKDSSSEIGISKVEESFSHGKAIGQNGNMDNSQVRQQTHIQNQQSAKTSAANNDKPSLVLSADPKLPSILDASVTINGSVNLKYDMEQMTEHKASREMKQNGTSILEEILGTTSMLNIHGASNANELPDKDDGQDSYDAAAAAVQSSKFAHWFIEDEKKTNDPSSYGRANNLLSLIGVSDNNKVSDVKAATTQQQNMKEFPFLQASETSSFGLSSQGNTLPLPPPPKVVLTCEDLEQTILSEYGENSFIQKTTDLESWNPPTILSLDMQPMPTTTTSRTKADIIDNGASQHLLSLLQKGKGLQQQDVKQSYSFFNGSSTHDVSEEVVAPVENNKSLVVGGKSLTLETLFGSAFMEELQSVDAPVSAQRGGGSRRSDGPYGVIIDHENDALRLNQQQRQQQTKIGNDSEGSVDLLRLSKEQLQEDDIFSHSVKPAPSMNRVTIYKDEQPPPFGRLQPEMSIPYHHHNNNFQQQKSPQVYPPPFLNPHDPHINHQQQQPRVNSMENIHQDDDGPPPHLPRMSQFPGGGNMMHQLLPSSHNHHSNSAARPTIRGGGYDHHNLPFLHHHHQMLQQQQQQPPHMQRGPPHYQSGGNNNNNNQSSGFLHELNAMQQGFPFPHRPPPPNFNNLGHGMHQQHSINNGLDVNAAGSTGNGNMHSNNSHHSEAMKRLIEMELRANAKMQQQGSSMFGHDLDLAGFRYR